MQFSPPVLGQPPFPALTVMAPTTLSHQDGSHDLSWIRSDNLEHFDYAERSQKVLKFCDPDLTNADSTDKSYDLKTGCPKPVV